MSAAARLLMGQFLDWIASGQRTHADVMATWQSSCPRLSIWEDAMIEGLVRFAGDAERSVVLTNAGAPCWTRSRRCRRGWRRTDARSVFALALVLQEAVHQARGSSVSHADAKLSMPR